jgi:hypothetical protein
MASMTRDPLTLMNLRAQERHAAQRHTQPVSSGASPAASVETSTTHEMRPPWTPQERAMAILTLCNGLIAVALFYVTVTGKGLRR